MKHGVAFRKFSRTSSHRMLMLRNLVTSLFEHEQIKTTLPKARDAARLAEKIITMGKKGTNATYTNASAFLLKPTLLPKLFGTLAERYAARPGGYTRIHKFGNRQGDNAPFAILELVDNPRDLRYEMTARAVGWELLREKLRSKHPVALINGGMEGARELVDAERGLRFGEAGTLRPKTRWNLQKVLRFRDEGAFADISRKAGDHADHLLATPMAFKAIDEEQKKAIPSYRVRSRRRVGQILPGESHTALDLSQGDLGPSRTSQKQPTLTMKSLFGGKYKNP